MKLNLMKLFIDFLFIVTIFQNQIEYFFPFKLITLTDEILILFVLFFALYLVVKEKKMSKVAIKIGLSVLLFSFLGIYSCYLNSDFILSQVILANFLSIKFLLLTFSILCIPFKQKYIDYIISRFLFIGKISLVVAVINILLPRLYLKLFPWGFVSSRNGIISPCSIFEHPGTYGWYMLVIASYYYSLYLKNKSKNSKNKFILYSIFALLSMKAKVILGLIVIIGGGIIITSGKKISIKKMLIPLIIIGIIGITFYDFLVYTYKLYFTFDIQVTARAAFNIYSLDIAKKFFPLGVGFGKFGSFYAGVYYSEYYYQYGMNIVYGLRPENLLYATDTYWPSIIAEVGVLGAVIFVNILCNIMINIKKNFQYSEKNIIYLWSLLVFSQALVESLGAPTFNSAPQNIIIGVLLGIGLKRN